MKKLIVGSFAFVVALLLCTSVFAKTLDIYTFEGPDGLVDRGESEPIGNGDVLNIKSPYISQHKDNYKNDILNKGITINGDGEVSGTTAVTESGERVTIDGGRYDGFYMDATASSTMNNLDLTGFSGAIIMLGEYAQGEEGSNYLTANDSISPKLTLNDVNIYGNGYIRAIGKGSELNIVSNADPEDEYYTYIGNDNGLYVAYGATVNFKGNNIELADYTTLHNGTINNSSNLLFYNCEMSLNDESVFNNSKTLDNNYGCINVYDNSVFNNKGTMNNRGTVYLGARGPKFYSAPNALDYIDMISQEPIYIDGHPVYNNDGELYNDGQVVIDYNATFNNNNYIDNANSIAVLDGGLFNNKGTIDNEGGIFVFGQFENKGNVNSTEYLYIGKRGEDGGDVRPPVITDLRAISKDAYDYDYDEEDELSEYAIFNNDGTLVYDYGLIDEDGILNNNGTIISNGTVDDRYVTIYGELNNKGKIDAKYLWLGSGQITGGGIVTGAVLLEQKSSKISKAAAYEPSSHLIPILKNYGTVNVSEGIGGEDISYIYNAGTINLGGEENDRFEGSLIVDGGTINLLTDATYFNYAKKHSYINGTLNLINDSIDDLNMNSLYLEGTTNLQLDVKLAEIEGDYINVDGMADSVYDEEDQNDYIKKAEAVTSVNDGRFYINKIKIMTDTEEKRTEIPIANITPQEYINLGVHRAFGVYEYKVIITSETSSDSDPQLEKASSDPTVGDGTAGYDQDYDEEENLDEEGSEYGNTLVFIRKDN
ncbi:MAG: hypothetical protein J6T23_05520, partial [Elusimicrobia bacterium]|nr:hypothetical protein [Elusimicrobiota bacterium]